MANNGATLPQDPATLGAEDKGKGKGLASEQPMDISMDQEEEEEDEDEDDDEEEPAEEEEEDGLEEIDTNNIIASGRRTRGRVIDFAKAAQENPVENDDEDDDDDFPAPDEDTKMGED